MILTRMILDPKRYLTKRRKETNKKTKGLNKNKLTKKFEAPNSNSTSDTNGLEAQQTQIRGKIIEDKIGCLQLPLFAHC